MHHSGNGLGWGLLILGLATFSVFLSTCYLQPLCYDATSYHFLAHQLRFEHAIPLMGDAGFRSYGYPLVLKPFLQLSLDEFRFVVAVAQSVLVICLLLLLRWLLLPAGVAVSCTMLAVTWMCPVLFAYCPVILSDIVAVVALQTGLIRLSLLMCQSTASPRIYAFAAGVGLLLGFAGQVRPIYFHFAVVFCAWYFVHCCFFNTRRRGRRLENDTPNKQVPTHLSVWLLSRLKGWTGSVPALFSIVLGITIACLPTMVNNGKVHGSVAPLPKTDSLIGYHLVLGLWIDKWSSYDPPSEQFRHVILEWERKGWSVIRSHPDAKPGREEFFIELRQRPMHVLKCGLRHVYFAFEKWDVFPYTGVVTWWGRILHWTVNWVVLGLFVAEAIRRSVSFAQPAESESNADLASAHQLELLHPRQLYRNSFDRYYAQSQLLLLILIILTVAIVVPEERFTLAIYPSAIIYTVAVLERQWARLSR